MGFSVVARRSIGIQALRFYYQARQGTTTLEQDYLRGFWLTTDPNSEQPRRTVAVQIPHGADNVRMWLRPSADPDSGVAPGPGRYHTDAWIACVADTEQEALAMVSGYFDGDSPWVSNPDGTITAYRWTGQAHASTSEEIRTRTGTPLLFGPTSGTGRVRLANPGTADAHPTFHIHGPVGEGGFMITHVSTGRRLLYRDQIPAGSVLSIDTSTGTVLLDGVADRSGRLVVREWSTVPREGEAEYVFTAPERTDAVLHAQVKATYW
ncbi:hypothetical protein [Pseudactinotalea sp. Z1732]|uniref:hypothetical protein n=1 Tax=Micrococcales TaxID=85006 RepID=UPI003C7A761B